MKQERALAKKDLEKIFALHLDTGGSARLFKITASPRWLGFVGRRQFGNSRSLFFRKHDESQKNHRRNHQGILNPHPKNSGAPEKESGFRAHPGQRGNHSLIQNREFPKVSEPWRKPPGTERMAATAKTVERRQPDKWHRKAVNQRGGCFHQRSRRLFEITQTSLSAIAAAQIIGFKSAPVHGYNTPAAIGMPRTL